MLKSIEQEWEGFAAMVFHKTPAGEVQRKEMKKAFFAGGYAMLAACREIGEDHVSEEQGVQYMEDRWQEALAFSRKLLAEYSETN